MRMYFDTLNLKTTVSTVTVYRRWLLVVSETADRGATSLRWLQALGSRWWWSLCLHYFVVPVPRTRNYETTNNWTADIGCLAHRFVKNSWYRMPRAQVCKEQEWFVNLLHKLLFCERRLYVLSKPKGFIARRNFLFVAYCIQFYLPTYLMIGSQ